MEKEQYQTGVKAEEFARIIATQLSPSELDVVYDFALSLNVKTSPGPTQTVASEAAVGNLSVAPLAERTDRLAIRN